MSTYWGFVCKCHEPNIESEHWFNHGEDVLTDAFLKERAGQWPSIEGIDEWPQPVVHRTYETAGPIYWLRQHPNCVVMLRNEYGDERTIKEKK